jgi:hypothetical protein
MADEWFIYVVQCPSRRLPVEVDSVSHVHVKALPDGSAVLLLSDAPLTCPEAEARSEYAAQSWLDDVAAVENAAREIDPVTGELTPEQPAICLEWFLSRELIGD